MTELSFPSSFQEAAAIARKTAAPQARSVLLKNAMLDMAELADQMTAHTERIEITSETFPAAWVLATCCGSGKTVDLHYTSQHSKMTPQWWWTMLWNERINNPNVKVTPSSHVGAAAAADWIGLLRSTSDDLLHSVRSYEMILDSDRCSAAPSPKAQCCPAHKAVSDLINTAQKHHDAWTAERYSLSKSDAQVRYDSTGHGDFAVITDNADDAQYLCPPQGPYYDKYETVGPAIRLVPYFVDVFSIIKKTAKERLAPEAMTMPQAEYDIVDYAAILKGELARSPQMVSATHRCAQTAASIAYADRL